MYVQLVFYSYLKCISGNWIWETKQHLVTQTLFQLLHEIHSPFFKLRGHLLLLLRPICVSEYFRVVSAM